MFFSFVYLTRPFTLHMTNDNTTLQTTDMLSYGSQISYSYNTAARET